MPEKLQSPISTLTDDQGNHYRIEGVFGQGYEGMAVKGIVESVGPQVKNITPGNVVAIKFPNRLPDEEKKIALERETHILAREGSLLAKKTPKPGEEDQKTYLVVQAIPGEDLTNVIYNVSEQNGYKKITGKNTDLSDQDKANISYSLIRDFYALQLLGIVHCDLKPDNIMYDQKSGTAKIMDFGNAIDLTQPYRHDYFAGAGIKYIPPEAQADYEGKRIDQNSSKTDAYSLGVTLAAVNSNQCYDADDIPADIDGKPHLVMADVLGSNPSVKMPKDIHQIIQHLTQKDPSQRPENIALANGVQHSEALKDIRQVQERVNDLRKILLKQAPDQINQCFNEKEQEKAMQIMQLDKVAQLLNEFPKNQPEAFNKMAQQFAKSNDIPKSAREILKKVTTDQPAELKKLEAEMTKLKANSPLYQAKKTIDILEKHQDLATIRLELNQLKNSIPNTKENKDIQNYFNNTITGLDTLAQTQAKNIQAIRLKTLSARDLNETPAVQANNPIAEKMKQIVNDLVTMANANKKPATSGLSFRPEATYNQEGLKFFLASKTIRSLPGFPHNIKNMDEVEGMLNKLNDSITILPADRTNKSDLLKNMDKLKNDFSEVRTMSAANNKTEVKVDHKTKLH